MKDRSEAAQLGRRIEEQALKWWLARRGGRLIASNYRWRGGELDLIFEEPLRGGGFELVFVEVRARSSRGWVRAEESVTWPKRRRLLRTVERFLAAYRGKARGMRIDVLAWSDRDGFAHFRDAIRAD